MEFTSSAQNLVFENSNIKSILTRLTGAENVGDMAVTHWAVPIRNGNITGAIGFRSEGQRGAREETAHRRG
jgi:hypothetical protein